MAKVLRVSIKGQMPSGEEWSVNPVWSVGGDFGVPVSAAQANTIAIAIAAVAVPTGLLQAMSNSTTVTGCRVEARELDGTLESLAEANRVTVATGAGSAPHPFQTSLVISLRTTTPGASGRGRLYWPATGTTIDAATLRVASATHSSILSAAKTYLSGIETAIEATLTGVALAVWSRKLTGSLAVVNQLNVGNVFDVQRRRRDTLIETYLTTTYP